MTGASVAHGPDHHSEQVSSTVAVGRNLLPLLPEDRFDRQPIWNADRSACMVADVRLDNRAELASLLSLSASDLLSDSAILMSAWTRWGSQLLDHVIGGFAFAVWTPADQQLFAARDHAGERPLFYHQAPADSPLLFALSTMPAGLLALPGLHTTIEEARVADWLAAIPMDPGGSFFTSIRKLPAGHSIQVTRDGVRIIQYWHPSRARPTRFRRDSDYAEALSELIDRATLARLRTTGGIAAQLSSGLDSSAVVAAAARLLAPQGKRLTAFTAVPRQDFHDAALTKISGLLWSEAAGAKAVANLYPNIDHVLVDGGQRNLFTVMEDFAAAADEPSFIPANWLWMTDMLHQSRDRGATVLLVGYAGNATISFEDLDLLSLYLRRGHWAVLVRTLLRQRRLRNLSGRKAFAHTFQDFLSPGLRTRLNPAYLQYDLNHAALPTHSIERYHLLERTRDFLFPARNDFTASRAQFFDAYDFGPLNAAVQASAGLEERDPTADKRIWEFSYSIPPRQFYADGHSRSLIRRATQGRLPDSVRMDYNRGRQSADWFLTVRALLPAYHRELDLLEQSPLASRCLDLPRLRQLVDTFPDKGYEWNNTVLPWNLALMRGMAMGIFLRTQEALLARARP